MLKWEDPDCSRSIHDWPYLLGTRERRLSSGSFGAQRATGHSDPDCSFCSHSGSNRVSEAAQECVPGTSRVTGGNSWRSDVACALTVGVGGSGLTKGHEKSTVKIVGCAQNLRVSRWGVEEHLELTLIRHEPVRESQHVRLDRGGWGWVEDIDGSPASPKTEGFGHRVLWDLKLADDTICVFDVRQLRAHCLRRQSVVGTWHDDDSIGAGRFDPNRRHAG